MDNKIEELLRILYPEYDELEEKDNTKLQRMKLFIDENIEEINKHFCEEVEKIEQKNEKKDASSDEVEVDTEISDVTDSKQCEKTKYDENLNDRYILKNIIKEIKIDKYFKLLHPDYERLKQEEKYYVLDDKISIRDCIDAIDVYYQDCIVDGSGAKLMNLTDQMIIERALDLFHKQEKCFTPDDIEKFSSSVKYAKFKEAIDNIKEITQEENID